MIPPVLTFQIRTVPGVGKDRPHPCLTLGTEVRVDFKKTDGMSSLTCGRHRQEHVHQAKMQVIVG